MIWLMKSKKANMTVEASLVIPFVITVIMMLFYLLFFVYNRTILSESAYVASYRGSMLTDCTNEEVKKYTMAQAQSLISGKLAMNSDVDVTVDVKPYKITVTYLTSVGVPSVVVFDENLLMDAFSLEESASSVRLRPAAVLSGVRTLKKAYSEGEGNS